MCRRASRGTARLSLEEAEAITRHAEAGELDLDDSRIRREIARASRVVMRDHLWGEHHGRPRMRLVVLGAMATLAVWIAALIIPLLMFVAR